MAATYFATRFVGNYQKNKLSGSNIQILETMRISNTKYIQVIKVGGKCFAKYVAANTNINTKRRVKSCANASSLLLISATVIIQQLSEQPLILYLPGMALR